jgi:twinkle protein
MNDDNKPNYIPEDHAPHAQSVRDNYEPATRELLMPFPSTPIASWPRFTKLTGGFRPREFSILCGATGVGKTTCIANLSASLIEQRVPHFVASVETGRLDFVKRVMSAMAKEDFNTGDPVEVSRLKEFNARSGNHFMTESLWLSLYENRFSVGTLMADIAWMVEKHGIKVAFIDNLNFFLEITSAANAVIEMDRVIHELIIFCKNIDVHVVMVMHPKKTEGGRVESEFDIKGSSTAVQEAHNVFLFNRAGEDLVKQGFCGPGDRELKIAKMRRKGRASGCRLVLKTLAGVTYVEGDVV